MSLWTEKSLVGAVQGQHVGAPFSASGATQSTLNIQLGDIFFAMKGAEADGHDYVADAFAKGAVVAVVDHLNPAWQHLGPCVVVQDTLQALISAAHAQRQKMDLSKSQVIAITGSVGKTTTRLMLAHALKAYGSVFTSQKNYNTLEGVAIDFCRCPSNTEFAVFEVGMNHRGEIEPTVQLINPDIALITTIHENHIENLGSLEAIADEKSDIFLGLKPGGAAVYGLETNCLDVLLKKLNRCDSVQRITFSTQVKEATVVLDLDQQILRDGDQCGILALELQEKGQHFYRNALAVAACLKGLGLPLAPGIERLKTFKAQAGRGATQILSLQKKGNAPIHITLIDETYNASFTSTQAAILRMVALANPGQRKVIVLGDMLELGEYAEALHLNLIPEILDAQVDRVFCCGPLMKKVFDQLSPQIQGEWRPTSHELRDPLITELQDQDLVLLKGSNGMKLGALVSQLMELKTKEK